MQPAPVRAVQLFRFWFSRTGARARPSKQGSDWHAHFGAPRSDWSDSWCSDRGLLPGRLGIGTRLGIGEKGYMLLYSCTHTSTLKKSRTCKPHQGSMRSAGKTQSKRRQNASKTHAIYKKIVTATHRAIQRIQLRVINTRQWEKPSSNASSPQAKLIIRVIKRELDDRIDSITSKYKAAASISSTNVTAQRAMPRLNQRARAIQAKATTNNIERGLQVPSSRSPYGTSATHRYKEPPVPKHRRNSQPHK